MARKLNTRKIKSHKLNKNYKPLQMLTCYDYQTACLLNESDVDLILVGDSAGNVILGYETTISVSLQEMAIFSSALTMRNGITNRWCIQQ